MKLILILFVLLMVGCYYPNDMTPEQAQKAEWTNAYAIGCIFGYIMLIFIVNCVFPTDKDMTENNWYTKDKLVQVFKTVGSTIITSLITLFFIGIATIGFKEEGNPWVFKITLWIVFAVQLAMSITSLFQGRKNLSVWIFFLLSSIIMILSVCVVSLGYSIIPL